MLKKTISAIALATLALGAQAADVVLKVAASAVPHAEILNFVKPQLKAQGVDLQVREFSDYIQPNAAVEDKQLDANYAIEAKLNPTKDSLFLESGSSHYANFIAARKDRANDPSILKLVKALRTPEVKKFIQDKYKGAIIPAF